VRGNVKGELEVSELQHDLVDKWIEAVRPVFPAEARYYRRLDLKTYNTVIEVQWVLDGRTIPKKCSRISYRTSSEESRACPRSGE
jgi:hypothetical protein